MAEFPDNSLSRIARYVTNVDRDVFALRHLPEEVAAVLFAYYSRSPETLRENLLKLLDEGDLEMTGDLGSAPPPLTQAQEKAKAFHEKWVVGYGHGSVAEHAVVKLAVENVSILTSKLIEDSRLASFTEKSTRYVRFNPEKAHYPARVMNSPLAEEYRAAITRLMDAYIGWMTPVYDRVKAKTPQAEKQTPRAYEAALRATTCDILRYLLPTAAHTNIGITINARSLEGLITKLLSQPLAEGREIGEAIKREAMHEVPTLLKYADLNAYRAAQTLPCSQPGESVARNSAKIVGPYFSEEQAVQLIALPQEASSFDLAALLSERGKHDPAPRSLERIPLTFELTMDYGAFRDIQRHRIATLVTEPLSPDYGYDTPAEIAEYGYADDYRRLMDAAAETYHRLADAGCADEALYVLPLAYRVRTRMTANLRELFHFIELRTGRGGHPSYRKIALQMYEEVARVYPSIAAFIRPNKSVFALTRE